MNTRGTRAIRLRGVVLTAMPALVAGLFAGLPAADATSEYVEQANETTDGRRTYTGTIDGADYRVEMPERWNGTLILFSHGYYPPEWAPDEIALANRAETGEWLLDRGYALAASQFKNDGVGYVVKDAQEDQIALLDWFDEHVGEPRRTLTSGMSQGAVISALLSERNPHRFDGVATLCGEVDTHGTWNSALDIGFVVKTLLAPGEDIELVRASDPAGSTEALSNAVERARETPQGRARLALAGAVANIPAWYAAHEPEPTGVAERIAAQSLWTQWAYIVGMGPNGRVDLERQTGGNPSWNVGIDYRRQLARSSQRHLVRKAYRVAGAELRGDLERLARAPRIRPDRGALGFQYRYGVVRGTTPAPVVTLHTTGDGGAVPDQERWYAAQVRRHGHPRELRQLYIERGGHCSFSAADEIVTLRSLLDRVETGRWPSTSPPRLNRAVGDFGLSECPGLRYGRGRTGLTGVHPLHAAGVLAPVALSL